MPENNKPPPGFDEQKFRTNLLAKFPALKKTQLDLLVLIRQEMSEWQAAKILGVSDRTVESRCYHIRKKMGLKTEENLVTFLKTF
ncbi:MAG: LuxR C-terminal-related transcriptional regulator [Ignavibacteriota bacterium]